MRLRSWRRLGSPPAPLPAFEGKGIGSALIRHALDEARRRGLQVIPICPFFAAYMQRHAEVQDLLDPTWRRKFGLDQA